MTPDIAPVTPHAVEVRFPTADCRCQGSGAPLPDFHTVRVTAADVLGEGVPTHPGSFGIRTAAQALHGDCEPEPDCSSSEPGSEPGGGNVATSSSPGDEPENVLELEALARKIAEDFYAWRSVSYDVVYNGALEHIHDPFSEIEILRTGDDCTTRLSAPLLGDEAAEMQHHAEGGCREGTFICGEPYVTLCDRKICLTRYRFDFVRKSLVQDGIGCCIRSCCDGDEEFAVCDSVEALCDTRCGTPTLSPYQIDVKSDFPSNASGEGCDTPRGRSASLFNGNLISREYGPGVCLWRSINAIDFNTNSIKLTDYVLRYTASPTPSWTMMITGLDPAFAATYRTTEKICCDKVSGTLGLVSSSGCARIPGKYRISSYKNQGCNSCGEQRGICFGLCPTSSATGNPCAGQRTGHVVQSYAIFIGGLTGVRVAAEGLNAEGGDTGIGYDVCRPICLNLPIDLKLTIVVKGVKLNFDRTGNNNLGPFRWVGEFTLGDIMYIQRQNGRIYFWTLRTGGPGSIGSNGTLECCHFVPPGEPGIFLGSGMTGDAVGASPYYPCVTLTGPPPGFG